MKLFLVTLLMATSIIWQPNFETAKKLAKANDKLILLNFSGSDWCVPCIQLRKDYLESDAFGAMADQDLVLLNADFPRRKKNQLTPETIKRNETLAERYNKEGVFPFTLLLDADGNVLKTWKGKPEADVNAWISEIKSVCTTHHGR